MNGFAVKCTIKDERFSPFKSKDLTHQRLQNDDFPLSAWPMCHFRRWQFLFLNGKPVILQSELNKRKVCYDLKGSFPDTFKDVFIYVYIYLWTCSMNPSLLLIRKNCVMFQFKSVFIIHVNSNSFTSDVHVVTRNDSMKLSNTYHKMQTQAVCVFLSETP